MAQLSSSQLLEGKPIKVLLGNIPVCVIRVEGKVFAVEDTCSHSEASLSEGDVAGFKIECWLHGAEFDLRTGEAVTPPASIALKTFAVVEDGDVVSISSRETA
ncbi:MAG: non-heme iron oxygenase ferredoxin subunit [Actinomycetota bacterium]|jgi:3-phenylpropionate/trans-cinnamate dioxygenase ferredoxin component|tara:strand:- start:20073 stop:20381 length:309 start_codon:yes stop_codon:yes gene_type:complete